MFEKPPSPEQKSLRDQVLDAIIAHGMEEKTIELYMRWESERQREIRAADPTSGADIKFELERAQLFFDAGVLDDANEVYNEAVSMAEHEGLEHLLDA